MTQARRNASSVTTNLKYFFLGDWRKKVRVRFGSSQFSLNKDELMDFNEKS